MSFKGNLLACPNCGKPDHIGEFVTGWREIGNVYAIEGGGFERGRNYGRVEDPEHMAFFCSNQGCNVDEEIPLHRMVQLGRDGRPLEVAEGQGALDV